jgi:hypothetical protein
MARGVGVLALHPENPRYFLFRGKPTVLVTSGEHYGAVVNRDFDYVRYLDALAAAGLNLTRLFVGPYVEGERSLHFAGYDRNTLAPRPGRLLAPWGRSNAPGYANGGNKFYLDQWDESYFSRLKDFVGQASARGIVVEVVLFSNMYSDYTWRHSPLHAGNNVNGVGRGAWERFTTMKDSGLLARQDAMVRKVVGELGESENVYFEICNEPEDHRPEVMEWLAHIAAVIAETEGGLPRKHLIAHNSMRQTAIMPVVSVQNLHYTWGRDLIGAIEALGEAREGEHVMPVAFDESMGPLLHQTASQVRVEAWEFLIGGGAVYNGLSWEYTVDRPAGEGRGHHAVLKQLGVLRRFFDGLDILRMRADESVVARSSDGATARSLAKVGDDHLVYVHHGKRDSRGADTTYVLEPGEHSVELAVRLSAGRFKLYWIEPATGTVLGSESFTHDGGQRRFLSPVYAEDMLLRVKRAR